MLRSLHIARTGLETQQTQLDVISNNLANVSTTGHKRTRAIFEDLLYQTIRQPGAQSTQQTQLPSGFQLGVGSRTVATERIHQQGSLQQTSNELDLAINGRGFFQIQMPDGTTAYTRDGSFQKDSQGALVTVSIRSVALTAFVASWFVIPPCSSATVCVVPAVAPKTTACNRYAIPPDAGTVIVLKPKPQAAPEVLVCGAADAEVTL